MHPNLAVLHRDEQCRGGVTKAKWTFVRFRNVVEMESLPSGFTKLMRHELPGTRKLMFGIPAKCIGLEL